MQFRFERLGPPTYGTSDNSRDIGGCNIQIYIYIYTYIT